MSIEEENKKFSGLMAFIGIVGIIIVVVIAICLH